MYGDLQKDICTRSKQREQMIDLNGPKDICLIVIDRIALIIK